MGGTAFSRPSASAWNVFRGTEGRAARLFLGLLVGVAALLWALLVVAAYAPSSIGAAGPALMAGPSQVLLFALAWTVMMVAMMFPAAAPMVGLFVTLQRRASSESARPALSITAFLGVYVAVWAAFGVGVAALFDLRSALAPTWAVPGSWAFVGAAAVVMGAGVYQLTPLKRTCLRGCQSPFTFLLRFWRSGVRGALNLGARHAAYCVGCCAILFLVLFAVGVMSLPWMAFLGAVVFVEKALPPAHRAELGLGAAFIGLGVSFLAVPAWGHLALGL
jgi:predicted metal-binding membrane protein